MTAPAFAAAYVAAGLAVWALSERHQSDFLIAKRAQWRRDNLATYRAVRATSAAFMVALWPTVLPGALLRARDHRRRRDSLTPEMFTNDDGGTR